MNKEVSKLQFGTAEVFDIKDAKARQQIEDLKNTVIIIGKQVDVANKELEDILGV